MKYRKIAFIGAGNMAQAIIAGLVDSGYPAQYISVCAPSTLHRDALAARYGVISSDDNISCAQQAEVVVLAVKPQLMATVCKPLSQQVDFSHKLVLSIAAGISVARFQSILDEKLNIVRIMPNTPSLVGKGMSGLYAPTTVSDADRTFTTSLMSSVGKVCWVEEETQINGIIAAAGSAPAYFFLLMEAMQEEAIRQGFDPDTARLLVQQSACGAAALVEANPGTSLATLRENITSKGGTTAEALRVFNERQLTQTVADAMQAAVIRAKEMEKLF
ncbi:pyrroline-5-carboxylate reductase [Pectobacteriaceae bacterium CE70]|uniref:Pyrroline-5-carboxylate reductase n=1 Tax=Serratia sp. (strain ATCC 39006) TaxID=104623 RepID=A0A2I5TH65_SERS3|nr:pyrroline-5-carboxylate reductase [Serratia sp. ATCC 39006]WJV61846.1 pyrroline-5-carboxylate reductase [Pectobacteriaceae bacterium C52]WJV66116.1 pyrroline-5-carboxylate reductase [Pectobacteriaceae bacterium CE70]WJY10130.1 pyrroline-5-carboxylate reductase [Pectobacteriaceae bacterium C80]AUG99580.1 pyrroline-5-carboxylate reductase [Serratia sp. ATCC 39006]AUH03898.1 pyrroline-5-carboxylate reductase [Serratia sp. ATCC 39006]